MSPLPRRRPTRADIVVVLRLAKADAEVRGLERRLKSTLEGMERHRAALMKRRARIGWDGEMPAGVCKEIPRREGPRLRLAEHEASCAAAAAILQGSETEVLALSRELQQKRIETDELRIEVRERISSVLLGLYEVASAGRQPAVVGLEDQHCGGCRRRLPAVLLAEVRGEQGMTPCPRCRRLLYDAAWLERDFKPAVLRAVTRDGP